MNGMLKHGGCLVIIAVLVLVCPVTAAGDREPMGVYPAIGSYYLVANGADTSPVSITVRNETGIALDGLFTEFILNDPVLGNFSPLSINTSGGGIAGTVFTAGKVSGTAEITVKIHYEDGGVPYAKDFSVGQIRLLPPIPDTTLFNGTAPTPPNGWLVANSSDHCSEIVHVSNTSFISGYVYPIPNLPVAFSVNESQMGSFNPASTYTNSSGTAGSEFTTRYKSGNATLRANITYPVWGGTGTNLVEYIQKIDHDTPAMIPSGGILLPPEGEATVGNYTPVGVLIRDSHGNPVDNRRELDEGREAEKVTFSVTGSPGTPNSRAYFMPGSVDNITIQVNETGWALTTLRLDTVPGPNIIKIDPLTFVPDLKRTIYGIANGIPWTISTRIFTSEGNERSYIPADGIQKFFIVYQVMDEFGNGLQVKEVHITTDIGENFLASTNASGGLFIEYGPKTDVGDVNITATAVENSSATITNIVRFINLTANDMIFTATPQSMASYDAKPDYATLRASVVDEFGNSILGEQVKFVISDTWYDETYNVTEEMTLQNETEEGVGEVWGTTNEYGYAEVYLKPCSFTFDENAAGFDPSATGHCTVQAEWESQNGTIRKPITFTFKNYPYLSVSTSVSAPRVNVTGTVDVTLWVKGDGFQLTPKPVDAIMVIDRSGSMGRNYVDDGYGHQITRMAAAKTSAKSFVDQLNSSSGDRIGLVSYSYENSVTVNANLGTAFSTIKSRIDSLSSDGGTGMREALRKAIVEMRTRRNSDPRAIHAIVIMTDGNWNNGGSPLAIGKGYQLTSWVQSNRDNHVAGSSKYYGFSSLATNFEDEDYRWYTSSQIPSDSGTGGTIIGPVDGVQVVSQPIVIDEDTGQQTGSREYHTLNGVSYSSDGQFTNQNMSEYANNNGIKIYAISFAQNIPQAERDALTTLANSTGGFYRHAPTAQELTDIYGVIAGDLRKHAGVNTTTDVSFENIEVTNVSIPGAEVFEYQHLEGISTYIKRWKTGFSPTYEETRDDTQAWNENQAMNFTIGTMEINDNWQATFRLKVLQDGEIHIFDPDSIITFDDGTKSLSIPDTIVNAVSNLVNQSFEYGELTEENINVTQLGSTIYEWNWSRFYSGEFPVEEYYFISLDGGYQWYLVGEDVLSPEEIANEPIGHFQYDILRLLPHGMDASGVTVDFRIKAYALDVASPRMPRGPQIVRLPTNVTYITLE